MANFINYARGQLGTLNYQRRAARTSTILRDGSTSVRDAAAFARLHPFSLAFASITRSLDEDRCVNLVMQDVRPGAIFAGIKTALEFACGISADIGLPLRIVTFGKMLSDVESREIRAYVDREFGYQLEMKMESVRDMVGHSFHPLDYWIGTYWTTAHALDVASRLNVISRRSVIYLVQDYEPGFQPWSTEFALARSTYHAGFRFVINSSPVRQYLAQVEGVEIDPSFVFAPSIDLTRLEQAAMSRQPSPTPRIFFYGRPRTPRNLFDVGLAALYLVAGEFYSRGIDATFVSAGESHQDFALSPRHVLESRGKLAWADYFLVMANTDVVLSLQYSPHPSHPPLDAATSGAFAVTNELGGTRAGLHERLLVAEPDPSALAIQVIAAVDATLAGDTGSFDPSLKDRLGNNLSDVVESVAASLRRNDSNLYDA